MKKQKFKLTPKLKRKLDKLFSLFIHNRDKVCQICGKEGKLDTAHIIPRNCLTLRWHPKNAVLLCPFHHKWSIQSFHQNPLYFANWFITKYGQEHADILLKLSVVKNVEWREEDIQRLIDNLKV